jgi:hypothetical protein
VQIMASAPLSLTAQERSNAIISMRELRHAAGCHTQLLASRIRSMASLGVLKVLARGSIFEITAQDEIVRCRVLNAPEIDAEEGARCAAQMHDTLTGDVLTTNSPYIGLVFDVALGPAVFGPKTRAALERVFCAAEEAGKRLAVRIGSAAIQRLQFTSLCRECAPHAASVVESDAEEQRWLHAR